MEAPILRPSFFKWLVFRRVPSTRNGPNPLSLMPLTRRLFHALRLNLDKSRAIVERGRCEMKTEITGTFVFRSSRKALLPSSLNDDPHRLGCCLVVDHSDHIEPFRNVGQVQGLVARPCESANQTAIEAAQLRLPGCAEPRDYHWSHPIFSCAQPEPNLRAMCIQMQSSFCTAERSCVNGAR